VRAPERVGVGHRIGLIFAIIIGVSFVAHADTVSSDLGTAGPSNWGVLILSSSPNPQINQLDTIGTVGVDGGKLSVSGGSAVQITGNVYINSPGSLQNSGTIHGNVYVATGATVNNSGTISGKVFTGQTLTTLATANTAAASAYTTFKGLKPTQTVSGNTITGSSGTITIIAKNNGGLNVINLTSINLNGATLNLQGAAGTQFVINISGNMNVQSGSSINETGGLSKDDVVFNVTGNLSTSGPSATINGIVLDPIGSVQLSNGFIDGELVAGGSSVQIVSGSHVTQVAPVPEPSSLILLGSGLIGMGTLVRRKTRR